MTGKTRVARQWLPSGVHDAAVTSLRPSAASSHCVSWWRYHDEGGGRLPLDGGTMTWLERVQGAASSDCMPYHITHRWPTPQDPLSTLHLSFLTSFTNPLGSSTCPGSVSAYLGKGEAVARARELLACASCLRVAARCGSGAWRLRSPPAQHLGRAELASGVSCCANEPAPPRPVAVPSVSAELPFLPSPSPLPPARRYTRRPLTPPPALAPASDLATSTTHGPPSGSQLTSTTSSSPPARSPRPPSSARPAACGPPRAATA